MRRGPRSRKASSPGGGVALLYAAKALDGLTPENSDQKVGIDIVKRALQSPVRQVAENAGTDGSIVVGKLLDSNDPNCGFDAQTGEYVDMVKAGIIDPTKVVRLALQNAASVAGLLVTTEAMVAEKPEKKAAARDAARSRHGRHGRLLNRKSFFTSRPAPLRVPAFFFDGPVACGSGLNEIEPPLEALETAVDPVDAARDAGVLRFEEPEAFLDLDHRCLEVTNIVADSSEVFEDQVAAFF